MRVDCTLRKHYPRWVYLGESYRVTWSGNKIGGDNKQGVNSESRTCRGYCHTAQIANKSERNLPFRASESI